MSSFLVKLQAFCVKQKLITTQISFKGFAHICGRTFLENIFNISLKVEKVFDLKN